MKYLALVLALSGALCFPAGAQSLTEHEDRIAALERKVEALAREVRSLDDTVASVHETNVSLNDEVERLKGVVGSLSSRLYRVERGSR